MSRAEPRPFGPSLSVRLLLALLLLVVLFGSALWLQLVPRSSAAFLRHGDSLLQEGSATMRTLAEQQTLAVRELLQDLINHGSSARARELADLPLELVFPDLDAVRAMIHHSDQRRSERQRENVQRLLRELLRRAETLIEDEIAQADARQRLAIQDFAGSQRTQHLGIVIAMLAALLLVLGVSLHRLVVLPTQRLRNAARRIAQGDLELTLPPPAGGELGELGADFGNMLAQLRSSRAELQGFAERLEREVERQTAHLQQAMNDLRNSHQQLAKAERLAALGTLAGGIAHEFHNLIGGIRGCASELAAGDEDPDRQETIAVIQRAADRATGIVQQLLRFARRSVDRRGAVDLAGICQDALRLCEPAARRQAVELQIDLAADCLLEADGDALHQVVVNLLTNALQAMPQGGRLALQLTASASELRLAVRDSGSGIEPADLPHLFEPFFTTRTQDQDHTRRGTGLGLSVSYGIISAHGGRIEVASAPGAGACFTVILPRSGSRGGN